MKENRKGSKWLTGICVIKIHALLIASGPMQNKNQRSACQPGFTG